MRIRFSPLMGRAGREDLLYIYTVYRERSHESSCQLGDTNTLMAKRQRKGGKKCIFIST